MKHYETQLSEDMSYGLVTVASYCFVNTSPINTGNVPKLSRAAVHIVLCKFTLFRLASHGNLMKVGVELASRITFP